MRRLVLAYTGVMAPEAIQAVGLMAEDRRDVGLLAVLADRLNAGWTAASAPASAATPPPVRMSSACWTACRPERRW